MQVESPHAALLVLPINDEHHVCRLSDEGAVPVANFPCSGDARLFHEEGSQRIAVIDEKRRRAALYELLAEAPWLRLLVKPQPLPAGCRGHVAQALADTLLVGGHSTSGEALWQRREDHGSGEWECIPIPEALRRRGKAVDGLHVDGDRLIAVDDIVIPKWIFLYRIESDATLAMDRSIELSTHTSYEQVLASSLGHETLWLVSRGMNHGRVSGYVWGLDRRSLKPVVCWSATEGGGNWLMADTFRPNRSPMPPRTPAALAKAVAATEWKDELWVACEELGLHRIALRGRRAEWQGAAPVQVAGVELREVRAVIPSPARTCPGLFLLGSSIEGRVHHQFLHARALGLE